MVNKPSLENFVENIRLGEKIAFFRKQSGISQDVLAQRIGKTRSTVAAYENNIADITISILRDIAKALGIHIYDFVHELDVPGDSINPTGTTYVQELESQIKQLREDIGAIKKELADKNQELNDKNKIIALYEKREGDIEKKEAQIESKLQQMENLYNLLTKKPSSPT